MNKKFIFFIILLLIAVFVYKSFADYKRGEIVFYKDDSMELKIVVYQVNMPLHYNGPSTFIGCKSKNTRPQTWHTIQEKGWTQINSSIGLSNLGWDPSLEVLADAARKSYSVTDVGTMIFQNFGLGVDVTWDACGSFESWTVNEIPDELVDSAKYSKCLEESKVKENAGALNNGWGELNCKSYRFFDENSPVFFDLRAEQSGIASFKVSSKAFLGTEVYSVETRNYGETWEFGVQDSSE